MEPNRDDERVPGMDFAIERDLPFVDTGETAAVDVVAVVERFTSFEDFYATTRPSVGRALALTLRNDDLARDAVDEAMARAYQRWSYVNRLDNPGGWVYRVGLNWSRSLLRKLHRPTPIWIAEPGSTAAPVVQDPTIDQALDTLNVDQRAVVVCRLLLGLDERSTADVLGIRPGTVKSRLARALDRLHPLLAPLHAPHEEDPR
jgi:RNA polymerase sigma factor (sigma-70 family)